MANAPIKRIAVGNGVRASIWKNESNDNGPWFTVSISRTYKTGDEFKEATTFRRDDLLFVAKAAELAFTWCLNQQNKSAKKAATEK